MSMYMKYFVLIVLQIVITENYFISALPANINSETFPLDRVAQLTSQSIDFSRQKRGRKYLKMILYHEKVDDQHFWWSLKAFFA